MTRPDPWPHYLRAVVTVDGVGVLAPAPHRDESPFPFSAAVHIVTPCNPGGPELSTQENATRVEALRAALGPRRLVATVGSDAHGRHREHGFLVEGLDRDTARAIGAQFDQDAIYEWSDETLAVVSCTDDRVEHQPWRIVPTLADLH